MQVQANAFEGAEITPARASERSMRQIWDVGPLIEGGAGRGIGGSAGGRSYRPRAEQPWPRPLPVPPVPPIPRGDGQDEDKERRRRPVFRVEWDRWPILYEFESSLPELEPGSPYTLTFPDDGEAAAEGRRKLQRVRSETKGRPSPAGKDFHEWPPAATLEAGRIGRGKFIDRSENRSHDGSFRWFVAKADDGTRLAPMEQFDYYLVPRRSPFARY